MESNSKDRIFLFCGSGLTAVLTLFFLSIWFQYWSGALEVGIILGAVLVLLILSIALISTSPSPNSLRWSRILLWCAALGHVLVLTFGILRVTGAIQ